MINTLQPISNHHCHFWQVNPTSSSCNSSKFAPLRWPQHQLSMFTEMADFLGCEIEVQEVHYVHISTLQYIYLYTYTRCIYMYKYVHSIMYTSSVSTRPPWRVFWSKRCTRVTSMGSSPDEFFSVDVHRFESPVDDKSLSENKNTHTHTG